MDHATALFIVQTNDCTMLECMYDKSKGKNPASLLFLATKAVGERIRNPDKCYLLAPLLPTIVINAVRRHILLLVLAERGLRAGCMEFGRSVRLALVYCLLKRSWDPALALEHLPKIKGILEKLGNFFSLVNVLEEHANELEITAQKAHSATIEWFIATNQDRTSSNPLAGVRFYVNDGRGNQTVKSDLRHWTKTNYVPDCGQIRIEINHRGELNSLAIRNHCGFQSLLMVSGCAPELDADVIIPVLQNL